MRILSSERWNVGCVTHTLQGYGPGDEVCANLSVQKAEGGVPKAKGLPLSLSLSLSTPTMNLPVYLPGVSGCLLAL
jgi:hypothetical protein